MRYPSSVGSFLLFFVAMMASVIIAPPLMADDPPVDPSAPPVAWPADPNHDDHEVEVDPANLDYVTTLGDRILPSVDDPSLANVPRSPDDKELIYPIGLMATDSPLATNAKVVE